MANLTHNNRNYVIYFDISKNLEFIMEPDEVNKFQELIRNHNNRVENIPDEIYLTGIYLNRNNRLPEGFQCEEINANNVRFSQL